MLPVSRFTQAARMATRVAKSLPPPRLAMFMVPPMVTSGDDDGFGGVLAPLLADMMSWVSGFNQSIVWTNDIYLVGERVNGSYTGVMRLFASNETDLFVIPMPVSKEGDEVARFGPVLTAYGVIHVTAMFVKKFDTEILSQLFRFSIGTFCVLLLACLCFACVFSISGSRALDAGRETRRKRTNTQPTEATGQSVSWYQGAWAFAEMLLNQTQVSPETLSQRQLVFLTSLGIFFWLQVWLNEMKTDLIGFDSSSVPQTFADVERLNRTAVLMHTDPAYKMVKEEADHAPDSLIGRLFKGAWHLSAEYTSQRLDFVKPPQDVYETHVFMTSDFVFSFMSGFVCVTTYDILIGSEVLVESLQAPWYNQWLSRDTRATLDRIFTRVREAALLPRFMTKASDATPTEETLHCTYPSLESYIDMKMNAGTDSSIVVTMSHTYTTFRLLSCCCLAACLLLWMESRGVVRVASRAYTSLKKRVASKTRGRVVYEADQVPGLSLYPRQPTRVADMSGCRRLSSPVAASQQESGGSGCVCATPVGFIADSVTTSDPHVC